MTKKNVVMTDQDKQDVLAKLEWEGGFDYFIHGSEFPEYTDPEFRNLVDNFRKYALELEEFLGELDIGDDEEE